MTVRPVRAGDWPAIAALEDRTYGPVGLREGRAALEAKARVSPDTCFVVEYGGRLAGYLLALPYPAFQSPGLAEAETAAVRAGNLHLHDIAVAADLRRRGLAGRLLLRLSDTVRAARYERISLIAVAGSAPFWSAQGYRPHRGVAVPAGYGPQALYMSKALPPSRPVPCSGVLPLSGSLPPSASLSPSAELSPTAELSPSASLPPSAELSPSASLPPSASSSAPLSESSASTPLSKPLPPGGP